ncbi:MAG TPA: archaemetzincin [Cyclobacteriaceae bacterium]
MKLVHCLIVCLLFVGCDKSSKKRFIDTDIEKLKVNDVSLSEPGMGDWLDMHAESGQSFEQYKKVHPVSPNEKQNKIYLQPIGKFSFRELDIVTNTAEYIEIFFNLKVVMLPSIDEATISGKARRIHWQGHEQFLTTSILDSLQTKIPSDAIVVMAITAHDLYPDPNWNFVFGQARTKKRVGISSLFRFLPDESDSSANSSLGLERFIKTSSHEISHMFTCQHCTNAVCVMNGSNSVMEADERPNRLCTNCLSKLQWNLGFAVKPRQKNLLDFFSKHKLNKDHDYASKDLALLN